MQQSIPLIYAPRMGGQQLGWRGRLLSAGLAGMCLAVLVVATRISPDPAGIGTHEQLGLAACQFTRQTGVPCPTCGMTTSFAYFVRGQWAGSAYVQPMGFVLAASAGAIFWAGLYIAATGRATHRLLRLLPARYYVLLTCGLSIAAWAWKIFIHVRGLDGWK